MMEEFRTKYWLIFLLISVACTNTKIKEEDPQTLKGEIPPTEVTTVLAKSSRFEYLVHASGNVQSLVDVQIQSKMAGLIATVKVNNGIFVAKGAVLAELNNDKQKLAFDRAYVQLQEKQVTYNDLIIGYPNNADTVKFKKAIENIRFTSGLAGVEIGYREAKIEFENTFIKATVSGIVSDLDVKQGSTVAAGQVLCRLHDADNLVVISHVLEADALKLHIGSSAEIKTLSETAEIIKGTVSEINPRVDEKSNLVKVVVKLQRNKDLLPGMSVQITFIIPYNKNIIVPKEAVVIRSGKHVVFTAENGLAKWNYVTVGRENGKEIEIIEGLKENKAVIITNNLQLAHDAPVKKL
jgi:membrane fusion protein, multidrug efflux system